MGESSTVTLLADGSPVGRRIAVTARVFAGHGARFMARSRRQPAGPAAAGELRRAFEALGPTYVKLGQLVASSPGLFPEVLAEEFRACLDRVPPVPFSEVADVVTAELGATPDQLFARFDREPLAAASIAQVRAAELRDGTDVVVKVQRPSLRPRLDDDGRIVFLDFGICGTRDDRTRTIIRSGLPALLVSRDYQAVAAAIADLGAFLQPIDLDAAARDIAEIVEPILSRPLSDISYGELLVDVVRIGTRYEVRLPRELVLVAKQLVYFERYGKLMAPDWAILNDPTLIGFLFRHLTAPN